MLIPGKLLRGREVSGESDSVVSSDANLLQMKNLQGMRKILAYADVAWASSLFAAARKRVDASEQCMQKKISEVNSKRTQTLAHYMEFPVTKNSLLAWTSTEKGWLAGVERTRLQWQEDAETAVESEKRLKSAIIRRKIIESRYYKYEEMLNMMSENSSGMY